MLYAFVFLFVTTASAKTCEGLEKCTDPYNDVPGLVRCLISDALPKAGIQKVLREMVTKMCEGESVEEIGKQFKNILMEGADMNAISKVLSVFAPLEKCLKGHKTTLEEQTEVGTQVIGESATMAKIASSFKGRCNDQAMINQVAKMACPILTFDNVKFGMQLFKKKAGSPFECMKVVDKLVNVKDYGVV